jgi:hypothetical protein
MNFNDVNKPLLIEPGVKYFLSETLKQCRDFKYKHHNTLLNIGMFLLFMIILGILLFYKYKGKLTPKERHEKDNHKRQYILSKISNYQTAKKREQQELITGLPHWNNEYEVTRQRLR